MRKVRRNRVRDPIRIIIGNGEYEYDRDDFIYDILHTPIIWGSDNGMKNIIWLLDGLSRIPLENEHLRMKNLENIIYAFADNETRNYFDLFNFITEFETGGPRECIISSLQRLIECYRLYQLPDEENIIVSVQTLDFLRDRRYNRYVLCSTGIMANPVAHGSEQRDTIGVFEINITSIMLGNSLIYDLVPEGYNGPMVQGVNNHKQKNVFYATASINLDLVYLLFDITKCNKKEYSNPFQDNPMRMFSHLAERSMIFTLKKYNKHLL